MEQREFIVEQETAGQRIDRFLSGEDTGLSRSALQALVADGHVLCNGRQVAKSLKLKAGDTILLEIPDAKPIEAVPQDIPLDVVYEDQDVIVVNKPTGMVVHPAPGHPDGTLVNALLYHCGESLSGVGGQKRPGIVHRIDKDTSGLLIVAKNDFAHVRLAAQLQDHTLARTYRCIVMGNLREDAGTVNAPIGRCPADRKKMAVVAGGRNAVTHWMVLERYPGAAYVECRLETGRTHQIRVHMGSIGHPLFADERYGGMEIRKGTIYAKYKQFITNCFEICPRQALHAKTLGFVHPKTGKMCRFDSPLPQDMTLLLEKWRKYCKNMPTENETE